tara:strand:- start:495 stop:725 length:231 start_codon:yes stop_codon:yes gene_type:complete
MKNNKNSLERIKKILINNFSIKNINIDSDISKIKHWDSLKHLQFIMLLEKEFKIKFSINNNFNLKKISDFIRIIEK